MTRRVLVTMLLLWVAAAHAQRPEPSLQADRDAAEPAAAAWIKSNCTPFASDVPTQAELKSLMDALVSSSLIGLGESTHGDHQSQVFKSQVIRRLIQDQGLDQVCLEINRSAGQALDEYVNRGKGDFADVIRNQGVFKIWQTDDFASLIGWIRAYVLRTGKPVHIYGIDCQMPAKDLQVVLKYLRKCEPALADYDARLYSSLFAYDQQGKTYLAWLKSRAHGDYAKFAEPCQRIMKLLESRQRTDSRNPDYAEACYAATTAWQAFNAFEQSFGPQPEDFSKLSPAYMSRRDRFMGRNLLFRVGAKRACLWAHDGHVCGVLPPDVVNAGYTSLGCELKLAKGDQYVTVGFTWSTGVIHAKVEGAATPDLVALQKAAIPQVPVEANRKGDLGEFLGRLGPDRFYVDFRRADAATLKWGQLAYYRPSIGWLFNPSQFLNDPGEAVATIPSHDILVYTRRVSPSTLWVLP